MLAAIVESVLDLTLLPVALVHLPLPLNVVTFEPHTPPSLLSCWLRGTSRRFSAAALQLAWAAGLWMTVRALVLRAAAAALPLIRMCRGFSRQPRAHLLAPFQLGLWGFGPRTSCVPHQRYQILQVNAAAFRVLNRTAVTIRCARLNACCCYSNSRSLSPHDNSHRCMGHSAAGLAPLCPSLPVTQFV